MDAKPKNYASIAKRYAKEITDGKRIAGELTKAACVRFLADLKRTDLTFDARTANRWCTFMERHYHIKGQWAARHERIKLEAWEMFIVCNIFGFKRLDGTRRFNEAYVRVARKNGKSVLGALIGLGMFVFDGEFGSEVYCLDPATLVLCADLKWRPVGELDEGDELVAFDEDAPKRPETYRKFRTATVTSTSLIERPCKRILFEDGGEVIASNEHQWLCKRAPVGQRQDWSTTEELYEGSRIRYFGPPWQTDESREAGWLAGIYDGEGSIGTGRKPRAGFRINFAQKPGLVLDTTVRLLNEKGFSPSQPRHHASGCDNVDLSRGYECMKFLGSIRPIRLLEKAKQLYEGRALNRGQKWRVVRDVIDVGVHEVVAIETSTRTLLADGMFSHNSGATTEKQAWEVFGPARLMARNHPEFAEHYGVDINAKNLSCVADNSKMEPVVGNPGDGASPHCAIIDEFHEHTTWGQYNTFKTGMGARQQALLLIITTAGTSIASPCFEKDDEIRKILRGQMKADDVFGIIYAMDDTDDWTSVTAMKKANPNLGVSVSRRYLDSLLDAAKRSTSSEAAYKTKNLNVWTSSGAAFLKSLKWAACGDREMTLEQMVGKPCIFGVDLASRVDVVALVRLFFQPMDDGNLQYWAFPRFWLPENRVADDPSGQYARFRAEGCLELHEEDEIDFALLRAALKAEANQWTPAEIAFDPWRAIGIEQELRADGFVMVRIPQTVGHFADAMNELEASVDAGRLHHPDNAMFNWMASNLVAKEDTNGNRKPRREIAKNKIDGMVALLMAMNRALAHREQRYSMLFV